MMYDYTRRTFGGWGERKAIREVAEEVGGEVVIDGSDAPLVVQLPFQYTVLTLDLVRIGENGTRVYNRLRAPFNNVHGLSFRLRRATLLDRIAKFFGVRSTVVGSPSFDRRFVIRSNAPVQVRRLFDDGRMRSIIFGQPSMRLETDDGGFRLEPFPPGVSSLQCTIPAVEETQPLVRMFELFRVMLPRLEADDRDDADEVGRYIRRLRGPGGTIREEGLVLWRGEDAMRDAVSALAALGDDRAVGALVRALGRPDPALRARACAALGEIGDPRAIRPLVRMLGKDGGHAGRPVRAWAAEALDALGEGALADGLIDAMKGHVQWLPQHVGGYRPEVLEALVDSLRGASGHNAAIALAELDAIEVLPDMREAVRVVGEHSPRGVAVTAAIKQLEARAALPRPADSPEIVRDTLPRPAGEPAPDPGSLPRPARGSHDAD